MEYDYGHSDSSGTDDDLPPHVSQMPREGRGSGNGRGAVQKTQHGRLQNDQIHWFEQEAYSCVLRAFKAQSDAITWEKEGLLSQLRKELRVSDEEHRELLSKVDVDAMHRQMREWRQSGGNQPGFMTNVISAHGPTPSPTVSASQKKQKSAHLMPKMRLQPSLPNLHNSPVPSSSGPSGLPWNEEESARVRGKKSKGRPQPNVLQIAKTPQVAAPRRDQIVHKQPPGRSFGKSQSTALLNIDPLIGHKVMTRWPHDNRFYEATITTYNAKNGTHALVYDINTDHETWEWVNLKEMSPSDIRWDGPVPEGFGQGAIKKSIGCGVMSSKDGNGRDILKGQSTIDHLSSQNRTGRNGLRDIELRQTDRLLKEVERVVAVNYPDPVNMERAKKLLKEHELCLLEAIERLSEVSDEDGWNPPSSRTHSVDHVRIQSRQNRRNKNISGDEYDTAEDAGGQHSDGEPFIGQYGAPSDDVQDNDEYG